MYTGLSVAKECSMIPSDVNLAVITATPSTDTNKAEIKIEPTKRHNINNVISQIIKYYFCLTFENIR